MDAIRAGYSNITYGSTQDVRQRINDNSTQLTMEGTAGLATFATIKHSSKIGNGVMKAIESSKAIKADKQAKLISLASKFKPIAKFANTPIVKKTAGALAGLSAATALIGSTAKIADTCNFLQNVDGDRA